MLSAFSFKISFNCVSQILSSFNNWKVLQKLHSCLRSICCKVVKVCSGRAFSHIFISLLFLFIDVFSSLLIRFPFFSELCSSFESGSEDNTSFEKTPLSFHSMNISNNENHRYKSPECCLFTNKLTQSSELDSSILDRFGGNPFSQSNGSDALSILNTPENSSLSMVKMFDGLSLDDGQFPSATKIKEYKSVLSEANDAYIHFLTCQFLLDSYKVVKRNISPELASKVEEAVTGSVVGKLSVLKSKKGEVYNLLGLEKDQICISTKGTLSSSEKMLLNKEVAAVVKSNVQLLSSQQKTLRGKMQTNLKFYDTLLFVSIQFNWLQTLWSQLNYNFKLIN